MARCTWLLALSISVGLVGCGTVREIRDEISAKMPEAHAVISGNAPQAEAPLVVEHSGTKLSATAVPFVAPKHTWLKNKQIVLPTNKPIPVSEVVAVLAAKGINIISDLPLDTFTFAGTINQTDADSALRLVLGSVGLDFEADDARQLVTIKPLSVQTWIIPIANRRSAFASNAGSSGMQSSSQTSASLGTGQSNSGNTPGQTTTNTQSSSQSTGGSSSSQSSGQGQLAGGSSTSSNAGGQGSDANENFWGDLDRELSRRLTVLIPAPRQFAPRAQQIAAMPTPITGPGLQNSFAGPPNAQYGAMTGQNGSSNGPELYVEKRIGVHTLNPSTGAVRVQAPRWMLDELDEYITKTGAMLNARLSFQGMLVLVTNTQSRTEGFTLQGFGRFAAGRYGAVVSNNGLGGVTLSFPNGNIPNVTAGNQRVNGPLLGITSPLDGLSIFNEYLEERGGSSSIDEPLISTSSGVLGRYSNFLKDPYAKYKQNVAAGNTGSAVTGSETELVFQEYGTELNIFPRYDVSTGLVRAMIDLRSVLPDGQKTFVSPIGSGNTASEIRQTISLTRDLKLNGETVIRDGDLIVFGGQKKQTLQSSENGVPGPDGPIGGVLGSKYGQRTGGTYYFALRVSITPQ